MEEMDMAEMPETNETMVEREFTLQPDVYELKRDLPIFIEAMKNMVEIQMRGGCGSNPTPVIRDIHGHIVRMSSMLKDIDMEDRYMTRKYVPTQNDGSMLKSSPECTNNMW